ncbi:acetyltransferase [Paenisporosarcina sp. OV554]|uniref:acetyltransferase n=1 Tax=Paenisporosarcina sp. OV554 TaxID=2135694 RepID=UPI000D3F3881|nr:acetyltransferase [Paenisporosarcina sp. OV554]PUB10185.1 acetyltransferase EpsM [Paenisporosarcina sp. OV554]
MNIILVGDSGHAKVITDCVHSIKGFRVVAKLDDKYLEKHFAEGFIKGPLAILKEIMIEYSAKVLIAIGNNTVRKNIVDKFNFVDSDFISIVHENAVISDSAVIGIGTVVMPGVVINADARIGNHVILNTNSVIEHDCIVEDCVHISPGSILTGGVSVGEGSHIGAGSTIIPLQSIGNWSVIGAGSVVVSDIEDRVTAVGVPARVIKREGL